MQSHISAFGAKRSLGERGAWMRKGREIFISSLQKRSIFVVSAFVEEKGYIPSSMAIMYKCSSKLH